MQGWIGIVLRTASISGPCRIKITPAPRDCTKASLWNGRGIFSIVRYRDPAETISDKFPVWLTTGRRLQSYHTRTQTGRAQGIDYLLSEEALEVNPADVAGWGLRDGGWCELSSVRGSVEGQGKIHQPLPARNGLR